MNTPAVAAALDAIARGFHDLSLAVAATQAGGATAEPSPATAPARRCRCGGAVTYQEWTSKAGKQCRAHKCEQSRLGEEHYIEWV
jgi:hypothetical protein